MLSHLHIQNYALISHLDIDFHDGFSALTGETGAGKSIILGALALVMGGRADTKTITEGENKCCIEAIFNESGKEIIIRRELNINGRSRSFVNDEVVTQSELKTLASRLIDIHSQHQNLLIADDSFQREIIDALADNSSILQAYSQAYTDFRETEQQRNDLITLANRTRKDQDYLAFQFRQLQQAQLSDTEEQTQLEEEEFRLNHIEELKQELCNALRNIDGDDNGAISLIHATRMEHASQELAERLTSVEIELRDIADEMNRQLSQTEYDPERLQIVQERLDLLNTLLRKHGKNNLEELITYRDELAKQIEQIDNFDAQIEELTQVLAQRREAMEKAATLLTQSREKVRRPMSEQLIQSLTLLGIAHANVDIEISPLEDYTPTGHDNIQILFAANLNQSLHRASEVASGGEIARLMLCIKNLVASTNGLPTIIFDEIDAGVSGEVASQMGKIMQQMGNNRQIITITHLPQIAAQATEQYRVFKQDTDTRTETFITLLNEEERVHDIATMLSGKNITEASLQAAKQLINKQ